MRTLKYLIDKFTDEQILTRLVEIYPDQKKNIEGYEKVLKRLRKLKPKESKFTIHASKTDISGKEKEEDAFNWSLVFTRWEEWLGMVVKSSYKHLDAVCFCLWEMTFMGYSQQPIQRQRNNLFRMAEEIEN